MPRDKEKRIIYLGWQLKHYFFFQSTIKYEEKKREIIAIYSIQGRKKGRFNSVNLISIHLFRLA